jgi:prepilin-type N-terminal cleavage/methylation domain-containing protein
MKSFRKACRGQKGFTLIELLVVIMILGILAAVVTLAVTRFIGKGAKESANAEVVTVQAAIESCLADANSAQLDAAVTNWNGSVATSPKVGTYLVSSYMRTHSLKATYTIQTDGSISAATNVSWGQNLTFDNVTQKWG